MPELIDRLNKVASPASNEWISNAKKRKENPKAHKRSFVIATLILREIRRQKPINGMNQKKLAKILDVSPQYINKLLKGKDIISLPMICQIEDALGITLMLIPGYSTTQNKPQSQLHRMSAGSKVYNYCINDYSQPDKATGTNG